MLITKQQLNHLTVHVMLTILSADVSNWTAAPPTNSTGRLGNGGFFPFGMSGMFQGAALILFTFIGFDSMAYYPLNWYTSKAQQIAEFQKTVTTSILSINGILFISLIGATVALTSTWPYYLLVKIALQNLKKKTCTRHTRYRNHAIHKHSSIYVCIWLKTIHVIKIWFTISWKSLLANYMFVFWSAEGKFTVAECICQRRLVRNDFHRTNCRYNSTFWKVNNKQV